MLELGSQGNEAGLTGRKEENMSTDTTKPGDAYLAGLHAEAVRREERKLPRGLASECEYAAYVAGKQVCKDLQTTTVSDAADTLAYDMYKAAWRVAIANVVMVCQGCGEEGYSHATAEACEAVRQALRSLLADGNDYVYVHQAIEYVG